MLGISSMKNKKRRFWMVASSRVFHHLLFSKKYVQGYVSHLTINLVGFRLSDFSFGRVWGHLGELDEKSPTSLE